MARIDIAGVGIAYELLGAPGAPAVAITPGGRFGKDAPGVRELGEALAARGRRVLIWDRPNCGASGLCFEGESESAMQGRMLIELIRALELGPTALAGGSAGSRCSLLAAVHDPAAVSHLLQWWVSGGIVSLMMLGASYACEPAAAATMGGMEAVAALPAWADMLERNPRNREALLGLDPAGFIARMERWASAFIPQADSPVPGIAAQEFARLTMPVLIFRGSKRDAFHHARIAEWLHRLVPHSELIDSPWSDEEFVATQMAAAKAGSGHFRDWPRLAPAIAEFIER